MKILRYLKTIAKILRHIQSFVVFACWVAKFKELCSSIMEHASCICFHYRQISFLLFSLERSHHPIFQLKRGYQDNLLSGEMSYKCNQLAKMHQQLFCLCQGWTVFQHCTFFQLPHTLGHNFGRSYP